MTHASEKQPYGCSQPRMVELRSRLPLRMVELRSRLPLPGYRNPRLHPSKMTMNFMMGLAAAEAEDEEVEAEDELDSGTASGGHPPSAASDPVPAAQAAPRPVADNLGQAWADIFRAFPAAPAPMPAQDLGDWGPLAARLRSN